MIKRLLPICFLLYLFLFASAISVYAQQSQNDQMTAAVEGTGAAMEKAGEGSAAAAKKPEYQLPYEGLLPDNPLYFLKALRDRMIDFLITDPVKKGEFSILQADKRLSAGIALMEKGKGALAESTISRAEDYLIKAGQLRGNAKAQGKDVTSLTQKLAASLEAHQEHLATLAQKATGPLKDRFTSMQENAAKQRKTL